jgi:hypothetical protein
MGEVHQTLAWHAPAGVRSAAMRAALAAAVLALTASAAGAKLPASITIDIPPGGSATMTSPALPPTATKATVEIAPREDSMLRNLRVAFATIRSKKARLLGCLIFATAGFAGKEVASISAIEDSLQALFLSACIELARGTPFQEQARTAAAGCGGGGLGVPMTISGTKGRFELAAEGTPRARRSPLVGRCRRVGGALRLTLRGRRRGVPIRRIVGRKVSVGVANASPATGGPVTTTFDAR